MTEGPGKWGSNPKTLRKESPQKSAPPHPISPPQPPVLCFCFPFRLSSFPLSFSLPLPLPPLPSTAGFASFHLFLDPLSMQECLFVSLVPSLLSDCLSQKQEFLPSLIERHEG